MNRISVKTVSLNEQADELNREALRYNRWQNDLEETLTWIRAQDFEGADEMHRTLKKLSEEMMHQKKDLRVLEESLRRISGKYERTEEKIIESGEQQVFRREWTVQSVDLSSITGRLSQMGVKVAGED